MSDFEKSDSELGWVLDHDDDMRELTGCHWRLGDTIYIELFQTSDPGLSQYAIDSCFGSEHFGTCRRQFKERMDHSELWSVKQVSGAKAVAHGEAIDEAFQPYDGLGCYISYAAKH